LAGLRSDECPVFLTIRPIAENLSTATSYA
jgi:hypothetical protein